MHPPVMTFLREQAAVLPPRTGVLEIGSKNVNGSARDAFPAGTRWWGTDVLAGPGVDEVVDGAAVVPPFVPDTIVCCEVLEHAENARQIVQRAGEMLPPGGVVLLTMATHGRAPHSAFDGGPLREGEYYGNVDPEALIDWLAEAGFGDVTLYEDQHAGDLHAIATKLDMWAATCW